ncbi:uncharacterized protein LOC133194708 [Saccostrea echinata]|uniref:uncharacterized protein LOC133194708 n=1 Tax=Saccostrea echinata TaxID=191078 RepID=UPI002A8181E8|nr:uncharacterized protein LOC133194708 [Saccostrea echinata]
MQSDRAFHNFHWPDIGFTTNSKQDDVMLYKVPKPETKRLNPKRRKKAREKARIEKLKQYTGYSSSFVSAGQTLDGGYSYSGEQTEMPENEDNSLNISHQEVENSSNPDGNQAEVSNPSTVREEIQKNADASSNVQEIKEPTSQEDRHMAALIVRILADNNYKLDAEDLQDKVNMEPFPSGFNDTEAFVEFLKRFKDVFYFNNSETSVVSVEVGLLVNLEICLPHTGGYCKGDCNELHLCKFFVLNACEIWNCKFGHDYETPHNQRVLESHFMQYLYPEQVNSLLRALVNRKGVTVPGICRYYNSSLGCRNTETCPYLHVCTYVAETCRYYPFCKFSHNLLDVQPRSLLWKYGINMNYVKKEDVFKVLLKSAVTDNQNADNKKTIKQVTTGLVKKPLGETAASIAKSVESTLPYQWKPIGDENASGNWNEFTTEESRIIHLNLMKYKKAYERYLKFKNYSTTFGEKKLSIDFSKMEGVIESDSTSQTVALKKMSKEEIEQSNQN